MNPTLMMWLQMLGGYPTGSVVGNNDVEPRGMYQGLPRPFDTSMWAHQPTWGINKFNSGAPTNASPNSGDLIRSNQNYPHVSGTRAWDILQMLPYLYGGGQLTQPQKMAGGGNGPL